jgi:hypothetical protein
MSKLKHTKPFLAWHFVSDKLRDGRDIPADGVKLKQDGKLVMCETGLHASRVLLDALSYAPGCTVCRVKVSGNVIEDDDKLVASERTIVWRLEVKQLLLAFARQQALKVAHLWEMPKVVRQYLETGDESLRSAASAAASAASANATYAAANAAANAAASADASADAAYADAAYAVYAATYAAYTYAAYTYAAYAYAYAYGRVGRAAASADFKKSVNSDLLKMVNKAYRAQTAKK